MPTPSAATALSFGAGLSAHADAARAGAESARQAAVGLAAHGAGSADLALVYFSQHHLDSFASVVDAARAELSPGCLLAVSAESVLGGATELEDAPGVSILAARLPGVTLTPFTSERIAPVDDSTDGLVRLAQAIGAGDDLAATLLFADPFSMPMVRLLPALNRCRVESAEQGPHGVILGGMASAARQPGRNVLVLDDRVLRMGAVGVSLSGALRVDSVVSQGCRAIGEPMVVTKAKGNVIFTLGGRPALDALHDLLTDLPDQDRALLRDGLFLGRAVSEYRERFGRDDWLMRGVKGVEQSHKAIALDDVVRVGQTVRFHLRDGAAAHDDLAMLMDKQRLHEPPLGALLITCNARGRRLFGRPNHDAGAVSAAFLPPEPGEERARGGQSIEPAQPPVPLAGFFAAAEIGPVGGNTYLHSQTACLAMFRRA